MKKIIILFLVIFNNLHFYSEEIFYYDFKDIKILKISIRANYKTYVNNKYQGLYNKEYKSILNLNKINNIFNFSGNLFKLEKIITNGIHNGYKVNNIEDTNFSMDKNGNFIFEKKGINFPLIQGIPYFPDEMNIEKAYNNSGNVIVNLDDKEYILPIKITTQYAGKQRLWENIYDFFNIRYCYEEKNIFEDIKNIKGTHNLKLYFDNTKGLPVYIEDHFTEEFFLLDKTIKRSGFYLIFYSIGEIMDKEKIIKDLTDDKIITEKDKEYIKIEKREKGIALVLENLLFKPNSSILLDTEFEKIEKVYKVISKIENRTILIVGHTALSGTYEEQMRLSFERSKVIAEELIKKGIDPERILYTGKGALEPIAPNDTEENMKKNRRVEIIILED